MSIEIHESLSCAIVPNDFLLLLGGSIRVERFLLFFFISFGLQWFFGAQDYAI